MKKIKNIIVAVLMVMCISVNAHFVEQVQAEIDNRIQTLQLTKNEMVEAAAIFEQLHSNVIIKELEEDIADILNVIVASSNTSGALKLNKLITIVKTDRRVREQLVNVANIVLDAYKKCLSQKEISLQSCDRIFMTVAMLASRYYLSRFEKEFTIIFNKNKR